MRISDWSSDVCSSDLFLDGHETLVQAVTAKGPGFWLMAPLRVADGSLVLVNRGFVDAAHRDPATRSAARSAATVRVTGLLRMSAPGGAFLRPNDPDNERWYSRDVEAIAAAPGLAGPQVAPYFNE